MFWKVVRFILVVVVAFVAIVLVMNLPKLGVEMFNTVAGISAGDWVRYIVGAIIGSLAMWFATKRFGSSNDK